MPSTPIGIDRIRKHAALRGGCCLSNTILVTDGVKYARFQCSDGHVWTAALDHILYRGSWCPKCRAKWRVLSIEQMQQVAAKRSGVCLSKAYAGIETKLHWQCDKGHNWWATPDMVKNGGTWCPDCAGTRKKDIAFMQKVAKERGGRCLSRTYTSMHGSLLWECSKGHQWRAKPATVIHNRSWCLRCSGKAKKTIQEMHELAAKRGGKCLSRSYANTGVHLRWQCSQGHRWHASHNRVAQGTWCSTCNRGERVTIAVARKIAAKRGGKCLSRTISTNKDRLSWSCKESHRWQAIYSSVKRGSWCPKCSRKKAVKSRNLTLRARKT